MDLVPAVLSAKGAKNTVAGEVQEQYVQERCVAAGKRYFDVGGGAGW